MTVAWTPPSRLSHVRLFALGTVAFLAVLLALLFGVRMEAVAPGEGSFAARDLHEVRPALAGLIEPGWYEGQVLLSSGGGAVAVRLDAQGNGLTDPAAGPAREVVSYQVRDAGPRAAVSVDALRFHRLEPGDLLWPGQAVAALLTDEWRRELDLLEMNLEPPATGLPSSPGQLRREELRRRLAQAVLHVPESAPSWLVLEVRAVPRQAVAAGDIVATLVPCDGVTGRPRALVARLEIDEAHLAGIEPGQSVRLFSNVYNHRLHGTANGIVERIEPWPRRGEEGRRRYTVVASVHAAPFDPPLGSGCHGEIVVGRKLVYRIILEH
jgi:hypothetical protein